MPQPNKSAGYLGLALVCATLAAAVSNFAAVGDVSVWTQHNDNGRSGANLAETQLNTGSVNVGSFGKLFSYSVDGDVYAQPLVIPGVAIAGKGGHDVVYVATMNNSVYAFDANNNQGANALPLWQVSFNDPANGVTPVPATDLVSRQNIRNPGPVGIMSTPVIDQTTSTMYVLARTKEVIAGAPRWVQKLHALDIRSGAEKLGGPVEIHASVPGNGYDSVNGQVIFNPRTQAQRLSLALANGMVYIGWASLEDRDPYHGWLMAYDAATLNQLAVWCTTRDGSQAGLWQAGQAPSIDTDGSVYVTTGNGSLSAHLGGRNYGEAVVKLSPNLDSVIDWFAPENWATLNAQDLDFGSSGPLLIPGTNYLVAGGKDGMFFLLDRADLGHLQAGDAGALQRFHVTQGGGGIHHHIHGSPVFWNGPQGPTVYVQAEEDPLKAYRFNGPLLNPVPAMQASSIAPPGMPGGMLSVSANGAAAGSGILWASVPLIGDAAENIVPGILRAFDASDLTRQLWNSQMNAARDSLGNFAKYVPPTVANGRVYMATFSNQLIVYGLLGSVPPPPAGDLSVSSVQSTAQVDLTAVGSSDWARWPGYDHKATGGSQITTFTAVGGVAQSYANDLRTLVWSDGIQVPAGSSQSGVYVGGVGSGFVVRASAATTLRTLRFYVGGWNSAGRLTVRLSDGSAQEVTGAEFGASGQYGVVHTVSYKAGSVGQQVEVQWTQTSAAGNVTLQAAALGGTSGSAPPPPTNVQASDGTSMTSVTVTWSAVSGATSYTVYRSTSAGVQGSAVGTTTTPSLVDTTVVPGTTYYYGVTATGSGGTSALSAQNSGFAAGSSGGGTLTGTVQAVTSPVNLTTVGTSDWAHWPGYDHKVTGASQISTYAIVGVGSALSYGNDLRVLSWSDGTPTAAGSNAQGVYIAGVGNGFRVTAPASTTTRTLTVYVGGWNSTGQLTATLSDGSAAAFTSAALGVAGQYDGAYQLTYRAASAGQTLAVQWTQVTGTGNVTLQGAAVAGGATSPGPLRPHGTSADSRPAENTMAAPRPTSLAVPPSRLGVPQSSLETGTPRRAGR